MSVSSTVAPAGTNNYIHVNIDLSEVNNPVSLSVESGDNSTDTDINNDSGILKKMFEKITTDSFGVISSTESVQDTFLENVTIENLKLSGTLDYPGDIPWTNLAPINGFKTDSNSKLQYCIFEGVLYINIQGVVTPAVAQATPAVIAKLPFLFKRLCHTAKNAARLANFRLMLLQSAQQHQPSS